MDDHKTMNRWWVVVGALVIQVSLGSVYIWSVFQTPLRAAFPTWTEANVTLPAQLVLVCFAIAVIFGGRFQDKLGPRKVATVGGIVLGAGLIVAKFSGAIAESSVALAVLVLGYSVLGGIGIGAAYVCPIATCTKWFPDKRGLVTGLAVAGFGAGAFFFAPLAKALISGDYYQLLGVKLFRLPNLGVFNTFLTLGVIFLIAVVFGAQLLRNPPPGYAPAGWTPPTKAAGASSQRVDFTPTEMLQTPVFWLLWLTFFAGCTAGLQVIMKASPIWQSMSIVRIPQPVTEADFGRVSAAAAMAVSILAIFNAAGRILWGKVSDTIGRKTTLVLMFTLCGVTMLGLDAMRSYPLYLTGICLVGLCFGGYLALYPAVTADFYGTKHIGVNYGWMFSAFGAGGLCGPFLAAKLMRITTKIPYEVTQAEGTIVQRTFDVCNYRLAFVVAGVACLAAAALILALKPPRAPQA